MPEQPRAQKKPFKQTNHQIQRTDDYAWLRDKNWQEVISDPATLNQEIRSYLEAENHYTEEMMLPHKQQTNLLFEELKSRVIQDDQSPPDEDGDFAYYTRTVQSQQHLVFCRYPVGQTNKEEVLLDCNKLAKSFSYCKFGQCKHSPDHRFFAYAFDTKGGEEFQIKIRDLATHTDLDDTLNHVQGELIWTENEHAFIYTTLNKNHRPDRVMLHRLGDNPLNDTELYCETDPRFFISLYKTRSKKLLAINIHSHTTSEVRLLSAKQATQPNILVRAREEGIEYHVEEREGTLYILTNIDACKNFKLCTTPFAEDLNGTQIWEDFYVPPTDHLLDDFVIGKEFIACFEIHDAQAEIIVLPNSKHCSPYTLDFDEPVRALNFEEYSNYESPVFRLRYSSLRTPPCIYEHDTHRNTSIRIKEYPLPTPYTAEDYCSERQWAQAHDGTKIPISILYHKDTIMDGTAPLLLYGYGSYGTLIPTNFSSNRLSLVDRGFVYAIAHIRGGMEKGYAWYQNGKLTNKKNTFNDFIAVAKHLIQKQYTKQGNITIHGGSAGGLLIGSALNIDPQLFRCAVAEVPFVDVLNTICDATLPLTPPEWNEWGNPINDAQAYAYIASYSPYDNIQHQEYPAILATAGISDPRVTYWEPAKWVAKLREYKTDGNTLLLKTNMDCGHAGAAGRFDYLKEVAFVYSFILSMNDYA